MHVDQEDRHGWLRDERLLLQRLAADEVPLMGVCLGGQLVAKALHAHVRRLPSPEIGWPDVELTAEAAADPVFAGLPGRFPAFQWHLYHFELPAGRRRRSRGTTAASRPSAPAGRLGDPVPRRDHPGGRRSTGCAPSDPEEDGPLDVPASLAETEELIAGWNAFGRELCGQLPGGRGS